MRRALAVLAILSLSGCSLAVRAELLNPLNRGPQVEKIERPVCCLADAVPVSGDTVNGADSAPFPERFTSRVGPPDANGCTPWLARCEPQGYGLIWFNGRQQKAHRVAYQLFVGPIPEGMVLLHSCDNRRCVNLDHLRPGTTAENVRDRCQKGRSSDRRGEKSATAKLTETDVREVLRLLSTGLTQREVAAQFGVWQPAISKIHLRQRWAHLATEAVQ